MCVEAESERLLVCWVKSTPLFLLVCVQRPRERDRLVVDERSLEDPSIELHAPPSRDFLLAEKERETMSSICLFFPLCVHLYYKCKYNCLGKTREERDILETRARCRIVFLTLFLMDFIEDISLVLFS